MIRYSTPDVADRLGGTAAIMSSVTARTMGAQLPYADALHRCVSGVQNSYDSPAAEAVDICQSLYLCFK